MDMRFKLNGFNASIGGEQISVESVEVEYKDFNLTEIPAIIKEVGGIVKDFQQIMQQDNVSSSSIHSHYSSADSDSEGGVNTDDDGEYDPNGDEEF